MSLFDRLFGSGKSYVGAGRALVDDLSQRFRLEGWAPGRSPQYTSEEAAAISASLSGFQRVADAAAERKLGQGAKFLVHESVASEIQRMEASQALVDLADEQWFFGPAPGPPAEWESHVSTYLKAWLCDHSPIALIQLAGLLVRAGHSREARAALDVVGLYSDYARKKGISKDLINMVEGKRRDVLSKLAV